MRISELASHGGVPVGTVKYYLREGLLPPGEPTAATQAQYGEEHIARLHLVRALLGAGRLSVAATREVVRAIDSAALSMDEVLGVAHGALSATADSGTDLEVATKLANRYGWQPPADTPALTQLAGALEALAAAGFDVTPAMLDRYARAAIDVAEGDVADVTTHSSEAAVRHVVIGTLLMEPVLLAMRRLAHGAASARRFGDAPRRRATTKRTPNRPRRRS